MKRLIRYLLKKKYIYIIGIVAIVLGVMLDMYNPRLISQIIDDVLYGGNYQLLGRILLLIFFLNLFRAGFGYLREFTFDYASVKIVGKMRHDLYSHIQNLSVSYFDRKNTGELMARIKDDMDNIWHVIAFGAFLSLLMALYFIMASINLFILNWKLALVAISVMPILGYLVLKMNLAMGKNFSSISDQNASLNTTAQENIAGVRLVKAFAREKYEIQKFLDENQKYYKLHLKQGKIFAKYQPMIDGLVAAVLVMVIVIGGILVINGEITTGVLVAFSIYINMLIWPMRFLGWLTSLIAKCRASLKKVNAIFDEVPTVKNPENPVEPKENAGHVELIDVSFEYNEKTVLKDINIDAKPGSTIAIMGMTGAGKTTIVNLINRFYDVNKGAVKVDGVDIRNQDIHKLRSRIGVVLQDTFLFSDSIKENIKFGSNMDNQDRIRMAAKNARISDFIEKTDSGYETVVGERGMGLSGGQKQRLTIARAFLKNCSILILDDATAALDMETEQEIQKSLKKNEITKFLIAHRISAVHDADEILILNEGEIVERGTHDELLELKGIYYETYMNQYRDVKIG